MNRHARHTAVSCGVALVAALFAQAGSATSTPSAPVPPAVAGKGHVVRVYYFHTTQRCSSCKKIESFADEAIRSGFASEIEDGKLEWVVVNLDEAANQHFVSDYKLYTKSLVVVDSTDGLQTRWKNLEKIWELVMQKEKFYDYVQDEVRSYLTASP